MNTFVACTIVTASHLARASVLRDMLAAVHPEVTLHVLVIDAPPHRVDTPEGTVMLNREQLPLSPDEYLDMAALYSPLELSCALKPYAARALLAAGAPRVIYLDADVAVLNDLSSFARDADETGLALTPHIRSRAAVAGDAADVEGVVLGSGLMNLGMFAVTSSAEQFLVWWSDRLRRECVDDVPAQRFVDQRWVDVALTAFPYTLSRDAGVNVGWWSLADADVVAREDGTFVVDGVDLRALHLSGFSPEAPYLLSDHAGPHPRTLVSRTPVLGALLESYAARLVAAGDRQQRLVPYGFASLADGTPYDRLMRSMFRAALLDAEAGAGERPPNPFAASGPSAFLSWLAFPTGALGARDPLSRYLSAFYAATPEAQEQFPAVPAGDSADFRAWCVDTERGVKPVLTSLAGQSTEWAIEHQEEHVSALVIAEATRERTAEASSMPDALIAAFAEADVPAERLDALLSGEPTPDDRRRLGNRPPSTDIAVVVGHLAAIPPLHHAGMSAASLSIPRIAFATWHGTCAPTGSGNAVNFLNGLAVPSSFSAAALDEAGVLDPVPIGLPVNPASDLGARMSAGLDAAHVAYLPVDLEDDGYRHDPTPVINAFRLLCDSVPNSALVIGLRGAGEHVIAAERIRWLAGDSAGISVVDTPPGPPWLDPWLAESDVVLALHRTEGFAWSAAIAMASHTPVVATRFGGNLDYMDDSNAVLVDPSAFDELDADALGMAAGSVLAVLDPDEIARALERVIAATGTVDLPRAYDAVMSSYAPAVVARRLTSLNAERLERGPAGDGEESWSGRRLPWRRRR